MFSRSVDVLVADLSVVEIDEDLLSLSELGRALRFGSPSALTQYLAAHTWLRCRLAEYLDVPAAEILLETGEHGKPVVATPQTDLTFNLAYSGWTGVLAVGFRRSVGIDVEALDGAEMNRSVAERVLTPIELDRLDRSINQVRTYLQFWVRKEALAKAVGLGVDSNMQSTDVSGLSPVFMSDYEISDLHLGDQFVASVAITPGFTINLTLDDSMTAPASELSPQQPAAVAV